MNASDLRMNPGRIVCFPPDSWVPGVPAAPDPDRLYAVMAPPDSGCSVGCVIRGEDCNWKSIGIVAHFPLPMKMSKAEALRLIRAGSFHLEP